LPLLAVLPSLDKFIETVSANENHGKYGNHGNHGNLWTDTMSKQTPPTPPGLSLEALQDLAHDTRRLAKKLKPLPGGAGPALAVR
jgi:hypothetical protein